MSDIQVTFRDLLTGLYHRLDSEADETRQHRHEEEIILRELRELARSTNGRVNKHDTRIKIVEKEVEKHLNEYVSKAAKAHEVRWHKRHFWVSIGGPIFGGGALLLIEYIVKYHP